MSDKTKKEEKKEKQINTFQYLEDVTTETVSNSTTFH